MLETFLITNDPVLAVEAEAAGVSRIMVDLETRGKKERQASRNTFISTHIPDDVITMRRALKKAALIVRINGWHENSREELEHALGAGADFIMLPMIQRMEQFNEFMQMLAGRAKALPLLETIFSAEHAEEMAAHEDVSEVYIGLNDLSLELKSHFLFEPLASGLVEKIAAPFKAQSKAFGFGGIAILSGGELPGARLIAEHARIGSTRVILSSRFAKDVQITVPEGRAERLKKHVTELQEAYIAALKRSADQVAKDKDETFALIQKLATERH